MSSLLREIKEMSSQGFTKDEIRELLEIPDQKVAAETAKKDAEAASKINLNDVQSLSEVDREVLRCLDKDLVPILERLGASVSEIEDLRKKLMVQFAKVYECLIRAAG